MSRIHPECPDSAEARLRQEPDEEDEEEDGGDENDDDDREDDGYSELASQHSGDAHCGGGNR